MFICNDPAIGFLMVYFIWSVFIIFTIFIFSYLILCRFLSYSVHLISYFEVFIILLLLFLMFYFICFDLIHVFFLLFYFFSWFILFKAFWSFLQFSFSRLILCRFLSHSMCCPFVLKFLIILLFFYYFISCILIESMVFLQHCFYFMCLFHFIL